MRTYHRRRQQYLFASVLAVIGAINLLFFFILYRPIRGDYFQMQDAIQKARVEVRQRQMNIDRLEKLSAQLETSAADRDRLYTMHFIPKNRGWSEILPQLDGMIQRSGVRNTRKEYNTDEAPQYGLYSVKIRLPVSGLYPNVMKLIKEIESANTLFIIDSIDVRGSQDSGAPEISMNLNLETFFYQ